MQNAHVCQTGTRWFQQLNGISYPKPLKKLMHLFVWGSDPLATRLILLYKHSRQIKKKALQENQGY